MMAAIPGQPPSPYPSLQPELNEYRVWLRASHQVHGLRESLGSHRGPDGRGYDASVCVSPAVSGRLQIPHGSVVLGSASTLPTGHADPGLPPPSWPGPPVSADPGKRARLCKFWGQTSAVAAFFGLERELGPWG